MNTWISLQFSVLGGIINISPNRAASGAGDSTITRNATLRSPTAIETLIVIGRRELCLRKSKGGSRGTGLAALRLNNLLLFSFRSDLEYVSDPQQRPSKVWLKAMETFSIQSKLYDMKKSPNNIKTFFNTILPDLFKDLDMTNIPSTPKKVNGWISTLPVVATRRWLFVFVPGATVKYLSLHLQLWVTLATLAVFGRILPQFYTPPDLFVKKRVSLPPNDKISEDHL